MIPIPIATPAGIAKRTTDCRKRSGRHGPELGASASTNAGMPIVTGEAIVNWRGRSPEVPVGRVTAGPRTALNTVLVMNSRATRWMLRFAHPELLAFLEAGAGVEYTVAMAGN